MRPTFYYGVLIFVLAVFGTTPFDARGESLIFSCHARGKQGLEAEFKINEVGEARLVLGSNAVCKLGIEMFEVPIQALLPAMDFRLKNLGCFPKLDSATEKILLSPIYLKITRPQAKAPLVVKVQWNRYEQPSTCTITVLRNEDLRRDQKKWKKGLWGR